MVEADAFQARSVLLGLLTAWGRLPSTARRACEVQSGRGRAQEGPPRSRRAAGCPRGRTGLGHLVDDVDHVGRGHGAAAALQAALRLLQAHVDVVDRAARRARVAILVCLLEPAAGNGAQADRDTLRNGLLSGTTSVSRIFTDMIVLQQGGRGCGVQVPHTPLPAERRPGARERGVMGRGWNMDAGVVSRCMA